MTILPIATNEYMSELEVSFRNLYKEKMQLQPEKGNESDVLIGKISLNDSVDARYYKDQPIRLTNDIRNASHQYNNYASVIKVTSKKYGDSDFCDQYSIPLPPERPNIYVDTLYGILVNDLRFNNDSKRNDRIISLNDMGVVAKLSEHDQIEMLKLRQRTVTKAEYLYQLSSTGLIVQSEWLEFLDTLEFNNIDDSFKQRDSYEQVLESFANTETKIKKNMFNYLKTGEENYLIYSYYYQLLNNKQYTEFKLPQRQYVKEKVA